MNYASKLLESLLNYVSEQLNQRLMKIFVIKSAEYIYDIGKPFTSQMTQERD